MKLQTVTSCGSCLDVVVNWSGPEAAVGLGVFDDALKILCKVCETYKNFEQGLGQGLVVNLRSGTLMRGTGISLGGVTQRLNHAIARHLLLFLAHKRKHLVLGVRKCVIMQLC